jgi:hypothetical protein
MSKAIMVGCLVGGVVLLATIFAGRPHTASHHTSPAFQALLDEAIARLEGVPQDITAATVGEAQAGPAQETMFGSLTCTRPECVSYTFDGAYTCFSEPTCDDKFTCERFYTCDSYYTCHGEVTCNGCWTCWYSTCDQPEMTCDGSWMTCDYANPDCIEWTYQGWYTCDGTFTCGVAMTCAGWPECGGGPSGTERTTWGRTKSLFR